VNELDRVLDGDDVILAVAVGHIDDRGERGRFAASSRASHQHHSRAAWPAWKPPRQSQLFGCQNGVGDFPEDRAHTVLLHKEVGAGSAPAREFHGRSQRPRFFEHLDLVLGVIRKAWTAGRRWSAACYLMRSISPRILRAGAGLLQGAGRGPLLVHQLEKASILAMDLSSPGCVPGMIIWLFQTLSSQPARPICRSVSRRPPATVEGFDHISASLLRLESAGVSGLRWNPEAGRPRFWACRRSFSALVSASG